MRPGWTQLRPRPFAAGNVPRFRARCGARRAVIRTVCGEAIGLVAGCKRGRNSIQEAAAASRLVQTDRAFSCSPLDRRSPEHADWNFRGPFSTIHENGRGAVRAPAHSTVLICVGYFTTATL